MNYPIDLELLSKLELVYKTNSLKKGDSWRDTSLKFLYNKSIEEFTEITNSGTIEGMRKEILDCILVLSMLYKRSNQFEGLQMQRTKNKKMIDLSGEEDN